MTKVCKTPRKRGQSLIELWPSSFLQLFSPVNVFRYTFDNQCLPIPYPSPFCLFCGGHCILKCSTLFTTLRHIFELNLMRKGFFPQGLSGKESTCNAGDAGDVGSVPVWGRFLGGEHGNLLQYSCLENPMDRGV